MCVHKQTYTSMCVCLCVCVCVCKNMSADVYRVPFGVQFQILSPLDD